MKKIISTLLLATFCIFTQLHAQNRADELMKQAQENLTKIDLNGESTGNYLIEIETEDTLLTGSFSL